MSYLVNELIEYSTKRNRKCLSKSRSSELQALEPSQNLVSFLSGGYHHVSSFQDIGSSEGSRWVVTSVPGSARAIACSIASQIS
jgi:hypothetical protein